MTEKHCKMEDAEKTAICRLRKNGDAYRHIEGNTFKNLRTGIDWEIDEDKAAEIFVIDYNASMMLNKYPIIEEMIFKLKLRLEKL